MVDTKTVLARVISTYQTHRLTYFAGMAVLFVVDVVALAGWATFYPMLVWSAVLAVHFLTYRSLTVDDAWVDERLSKVRDQPWDTGHIQEIRRNPFGRSPYRTEEGRVGERRDPPDKV